MSIAVNIYRATSIRAEAGHNDGTHWVVLTFSEPSQEFRACSFFDDGELADAYAAAVNGVMAQFAKPAPSTSAQEAPAEAEPVGETAA